MFQQLLKQNDEPKYISDELQSFDQSGQDYATVDVYSICDKRHHHGHFVIAIGQRRDVRIDHQLYRTRLYGCEGDGHRIFKPPFK